MDELYYIVRITVGGNRFFLLWNGDDEPPFLTDDDDDGILVFKGLFDATAFAEENAMELEDGVTAYDLDEITVTEALDCNEVIEKLNLISDLAMTTGEDFSGDSDDFGDIYEKLFRGCNLPAMRQEPYTPEWSEEEIAEINRILSEGAELCKRILNENSL